jgi:Tfp pilus assembly protein PilO
LSQFRYEGTGGGDISLRGKLLIALLIIALLAVYYILGMDYMKQRQEHEALAFQITTINQTLEQMSEPPQNLEQRLETAQERLSAEQNLFPSQLNSTEVVNSILELANQCGVDAIPLVTQSLSTEIVGENSYNILRLSVAAEGSFSQLYSFVSQLENGEYQTLVVEDMTVTRVTPLSEDETGFEETILYIASFDLAIYAQCTTSD